MSDLEFNCDLRRHDGEDVERSIFFYRLFLQVLTTLMVIQTIFELLLTV